MLHFFPHLLLGEKKKKGEKGYQVTMPELCYRTLTLTFTSNGEKAFPLYDSESAFDTSKLPSDKLPPVDIPFPELALTP